MMKQFYSPNHEKANSRDLPIPGILYLNLNFLIKNSQSCPINSFAQSPLTKIVSKSNCEIHFSTPVVLQKRFKCWHEEYRKLVS